MAELLCDQFLSGFPQDFVEDLARTLSEHKEMANSRSTGQEERPRLRLRVTSAAEKMLRLGHPWLYAESIHAQNREGDPGELGVVFDRRDRFLAVGLYDPLSPIRLRVLHSGKPQSIDAEWWRTRLHEAIIRREERFDERTTGYRCIHGESDGWPGLVLDRYDRTLVVKLYTAAWFPHLEPILDLVGERVPCDGIVLRLSRNIQWRAERSGWRDGQSVRGSEVQGKVVFLESGLRFEADVVRGQKTGFFLDQRENRRFVETLSSGRAVLNAFSYSGGFSLYAARGGARSAASLDISAHALVAAERNFALNQEAPRVAACSHETIQAGVFEWLRSNPGRKFGLIILDPPSLARREAERGEAIRAYGRLAAEGINHLAAGGILAAASCSAHVSAEEFFAAVRTAADRSNRRFEELKRTGHPPDHPAAFKEAEYLKCIYLKMR